MLLSSCCLDVLNVVSSFFAASIEATICFSFFDRLRAWSLSYSDCSSICYNLASFSRFSYLSISTALKISGSQSSGGFVSSISSESLLISDSSDRSDESSSSSSRYSAAMGLTSTLLLSSSYFCCFTLIFFTFLLYILKSFCLNTPSGTVLLNFSCKSLSTAHISLASAAFWLIYCRSFSYY